MSKEEKIAKVKDQLRTDWLTQEKYLFDTYQAYDKTIIGINSAVLVLSFTLLKDTFGTKYFIGPIVFAIALFFISLITTLLSYVFGILSYQKKMENNAKIMSDLTLYGKLDLGAYPIATTVCNLLSGIFLVAGGLMIFYFFLYNH